VSSAVIADRPRVITSHGASARAGDRLNIEVTAGRSALSGSSSRCHQFDDAVDGRLIPVDEPVEDAALVVGQVVDVDASGGDDPSAPLGVMERPSAEPLGLSAGASGPKGRRNGLVGSTVHDQTSPSPRPGENYKLRQNLGLISG
jgi:hypothetical protein